MRASLDDVPVSAGVVKQDHQVSYRMDHRVSAWFWDHDLRFCKRHYERDRRSHIADCLAREAHTLHSHDLTP